MLKCRANCKTQQIKNCKYFKAERQITADIKTSDILYRSFFAFQRRPALAIYPGGQKVQARFHFGFAIGSTKKYFLTKF